MPSTKCSAIWSTRTSDFAKHGGKAGFAKISRIWNSLVAQFDAAPRYWLNDKPRHEVDFLVQAGNDVVPIEVKSGENVKSASLRYYRRKYGEETPLAVRMSLRNLAYGEGVLSLPLYLADHAARLIEATM